MRKKAVLVFCSFLLSMGALLTISCNENHETNRNALLKGATDNKKDSTIVTIRRQDEKLIPANLDTLIETKVEMKDTTGHEILLSKARAMVRKYLGSLRYIRHTAPGRDESDDTKYVWFDAAFVKSLYEAVQSERADGIRVYFGVYNERSDRDRNMFKTIIITTTIPKQIGSRVIHEDNLAEKAFFGKDYKNKLYNTDPLNHGGLCPPPNSCYNEGARLLPSNQ